MSLQDFTRIWVPIIQAGIGLLGLCSLGLVAWQIRRTNYWNRLNFSNNYTASSSSGMELERKVLVATKHLGIDLNSNIPLTETDVDKLWENESEDAYYAIREYLSTLEKLCVGIRIGAADLELAYAVHHLQIISAQRLFETFIQRMRKGQGSNEIYVELETVAGDFRRRQDIELAGKSELARVVISKH
jgi:hypothetical protein